MENTKNTKEPSLKHSLIWLTVGGLIFGLFPWFNLFLETTLRFRPVFFVRILWAPLALIMYVAQPIFDLESEQQIIYIIASPLFWTILGLVIGFGIYRLRYAVFHRAEYILATAPGERYLNQLRIFIAFALALFLAVSAVFLYRDVIKIKTSAKEQARLFAEKVDAKRQKRLEEELRQMEADRKKQEETKEKKVETKELSPEEQKRIFQNLKWKHYSNAKLGIAFDYPADWAVQKKDLEGEEFDLWVVRPGESKDPLVPDPPRVTILGTKQNFRPDHPNNIAGGCAYEYKNVSEFCQKGCEKVNANTVIDFRFMNQGEPIYSAVGFSSVSRLFPRLCVDMSLDQLLFSIASPQDKSVEMLVEEYNLKSSDDGSKISPDVFEAVAIFKHMAGSLAPAK